MIADNKNLNGTKIDEIEKKILHHNHDLYITTQEFNELKSEKFDVRLKQTNLKSKNDTDDFEGKKTDFDDEIKNLNKKVTLNKAKHVLFQNELNKLSKKVKLLSTKELLTLNKAKHVLLKNGLNKLSKKVKLISTKSY